MAFAGHLWVLLIMVLFWGGLIALLIWAIRRAGSNSGRDSGIRILQERFARGEIDQQEFEQRKAALMR